MAKCYLYVIFKILEMIEWTLTGTGVIFFSYKHSQKTQKEGTSEEKTQKNETEVCKNARWQTMVLIREYSLNR